MRRILVILIGATFVTAHAMAATAVPPLDAVGNAVRAAATSPAPGKSGGGGKPAPARPDTARVRLGPAPDGTTAFVAWPTGEGARPGIVVVHEWWGLNGQIRDVARKLAKEGYVAIVPDLYHGKVADDPERAHELSRGVDEPRALADMHAAARWLRSQERVAKNRIGVIGYCMGGGLAEAWALDTSGVAAAVVFYGSPVTDSTRLSTLKAPLQAHFGAEDEGISMAKVGELKAGLARQGKVSEIYVYPGAGHAFMNEGRPSYHADAARQAWARTLAFLQKYLKS